MVYSKFKIVFGICTGRFYNKVLVMVTIVIRWKKIINLPVSGGMYLPRSDSGRIIVGTWWLVVLVVVTTYCGNLVAFLTFPKMEIPVNTINQLVTNEHGFTWSVRSNTYMEMYIRVSCPKISHVTTGSNCFTLTFKGNRDRKIYKIE